VVNQHFSSEEETSVLAFSSCSALLVLVHIVTHRKILGKLAEGKVGMHKQPAFEGKPASDTGD
jgi:hypothetical protein